MESITITKKSLFEAFEQWSKDFKANGGKTPYTGGTHQSEGQAEYLFNLLVAQKNES